MTRREIALVATLIAFGLGGCSSDSAATDSAAGGGATVSGGAGGSAGTRAGTMGAGGSANESGSSGTGGATSAPPSANGGKDTAGPAGGGLAAGGTNSAGGESAGSTNSAGGMGAGGSAGRSELLGGGGVANDASTGGGGVTGAERLPTDGGSDAEDGATSVLATRCDRSKDFCLCMPLDVSPEQEVYECSAASIGGYCCADVVSAEALQSCTCRHYACQDDSLGCECGSHVTGTKSKCSKTYETCCMHKVGGWASCMCDSMGIPCDPDWVEVTSCDISKDFCAEDETQVDACKTL